MELESSEKRQVLEELVDLLCDAYKLSERNSILEAILKREEQQSTGIGLGLAVPHAKTTVVDRLYVCMGLSRSGIEFDSVDGEKAKIFFLLLSPKDVSGPHIKALTGISRLIKHDDFRKELLDCQKDGDIIKVIRKAEKKYL